jgi:hypothetical protein
MTENSSKFFVFFHKNKVYKCFELPSLTSIMNFTVFCGRDSESILYSIFNFHMTIRQRKWVKIGVIGQAESSDDVYF